MTVYGDGEQTRDFTFVSDIVAANLAAAEQGRPGSVYNIGGGSRVTLNHVLDLIGTRDRQDLSRFNANRNKKATCATPTPIPRSPAAISNSPRVSLESGLEQQYRWLTR